MCVLKKDKLNIIKLYDLKNDPKELKNLYSNKDNTNKYANITSKLLLDIFKERKNLLRLRGIKTLKKNS